MWWFRPLRGVSSRSPAGWLFDLTVAAGIVALVIGAHSNG